MKRCANCGEPEKLHTAKERARCEEITGECFSDDGGFAATAITMGAWALLADLRDALVRASLDKGMATVESLVLRREALERALLAHPEWFAVKPSPPRCLMTKIFDDGKDERRCLRPSLHDGDHDFGVKP